MKDMLQSPTRRQLLSMIGKTAGATAMYQAMTTLGFASESTFQESMELEGAPPGASIIVLGAGLGGLTAAYELRQAGYNVKVLEFQNRGGGRSWTLNSGDRYTELGGAEVTCDFEEGNYFNGGPWRLPSHHYAVFHYCKKFGVEMQPFIQTNDRAYLHRTNHFGGVPQRLGDVKNDIQGNIAELMSKVVNVGGLDRSVNTEDKEKLLEGLKGWGVLDKDYRYRASNATSKHRGYSVLPGGGLMPTETPSKPLPMSEILDSGMWSDIYSNHMTYAHQPTMFQPVGGMGKIGDAFTRECRDMIEFNAKVTKIHQDETGVTVSYVDSNNPEGAVKTVRADWCVCNIPLTVLTQLDINVSKPMKQAMAAVPYDTSYKVGLEFKRRFWEEDEWIYGGLTYTNMPITQIAYPSEDMFKDGTGVLLGAYGFGATSYKFNTLTPQERINVALAYGKYIHPQYPKEFRAGTSVVWHRIPWTLGCYGIWSESSRKQHYDTLCSIDNRIVLTGEHCSHIPAWQEGAILSGIDAANRLHKKAKMLG
ncbi:flavin monoamine oxidase family protein [Psychrobacter celer]|uniref:flavin monoamine oxidase family protein n=1 Tax=Psychrobacter TaxID=497 RepID=UPI000C29DD01|nr:flavin monoamine oxidase family protein [Psychrobacter sp. L7]MDN5666091.1 flavin monoamine oxidase family protein [Psychrobacter sp.]PJX24279.1 flavin monoamine oxidase [Psychrobacter sp. L7]